jgi:hypothetical protein
VSEGEGERADLVAEADPETVHGLEAVAAAVYQYVLDMHGETPDKLSAGVLRHKMVNLRVAVSKQGGHATMRVRYYVPDDPTKWLLQVDVSRHQDALGVDR